MSLSIDVLNQLHDPANHVVSDNLRFLYESLNVLDRKADALMAFDGLLVAAAAFAMEKGGVIPTHLWRRRGALFVIVFALFAAGVCLQVTRVSYDFLGDTTIDSSGKLQISKELASLIGVVKLRSCYYLVAWWLSVIAVGLSLVIGISMFFVPLAAHLDASPPRN
jgi:hypothetical protein